MLLWNKEYQEYDLVVSSVTTKVKGVAKINIPDIGEVVWDVVDHSGTSQVTVISFTSFIIIAQKYCVCVCDSWLFCLNVRGKTHFLWRQMS